MIILHRPQPQLKNNGNLYNSYAILDSREITNTSAGWNVPTETQVQSLITYVSQNPDDLKTTDPLYWANVGDDSYGLSLIGSGFRGTDGLNSENYKALLGTSDTDTLSVLDGMITSIDVDNSNKIYMTGEFTGGFKRFNSDGSEDTTFTDNLPTIITNSNTYGVCVLSNQSILVGVNNNDPINYSGDIIKLNSDGTRDNTWLFDPFKKTYPTSPADAVIYNINTMFEDSSGNIYLGGGGNIYVARLLSTGAWDTTFNETAYNSSLGGNVDKYIEHSNGSFYAVKGGGVVKFSSTGVNDATFYGNLPTELKGQDIGNYDVQDMIVLSGGSLVAVIRDDIFKISTTGVDDTTFRTNKPNLPLIVSRVSVDNFDKILIGGNNNIGSNQGVTILNNDGTQNVTQSTALPTISGFVRYIAYDSTLNYYYVGSTSSPYATRLNTGRTGTDIFSVNQTVIKTFLITDSNTTIENYDENVGVSIRAVKDATGLADGITTVYVGNNGVEYIAVVINELYWTILNLVEDKYENGDNIPNVVPDVTWNGLTTGAWCKFTGTLPPEDEGGGGD